MKNVHWSDDKICVKITDEHGNIYLFKPYPPYYIADGKNTYGFDDIDDIKRTYFALQKLMEFVDGH